MATLSIDEIPDALVDRLATRAAANGRTPAEEVLGILEGALGDGAADWEDFVRRSDAVREGLRARYGTMAESRDLFRASRDVGDG